MRREAIETLRRVLVMALTVVMAGSLATSIATAAGGTTGHVAGSWTIVGTRTPLATTRISGAAAARISATSTRDTSRSLVRQRPSGFGTDARPVTVSATAGSARGARIALPGDLLSTREARGIDQTMVGAEPPDPWISVSSSYIVESTNGAVRILDRNGHELALMATWALFSIPGGYSDSDPRIIWDQTHGRWLGVVVAYDYPAFSDTFLSVIVSDGVDPRGGWTVLQYSYGPFLPDFPAIASSSDKVVLTANEFENGSTYTTSSFLLLSWASILNGTDVNALYGSDGTAWNLRPAQIVGASGDLHFVYESSDGTLRYLQLFGPMSNLDLLDVSLGLAAGTYTLPAPRQPGDGDGIALADDGRIPDAVWRAGQLWFGRTIAGSWDGGSTTDLVVELTRIDTASGNVPSVAGDAVTYHGGLASDTFMPGVGIGGDGSIFLEYSKSSAVAAPAMVAEALKPGYGWAGPIVIESSDANYAGDRWGDFVGIAADPVGSATAWQSNEVAAADGTWRTILSRLVLDFAAPAAPAIAPNQALVAGSTLGSSGPYTATVPVRISWGAASDPGSGVTAYRLRVAEFTDPTFYTLAYPAATSIVRPEYWKPYGSTANRTYRYQVAGIDDAGNSSSDVTGSALTPTTFQQTQYTTYSGTWHSTTSAAYSGGSIRYSSTAGASATFKVSGRSFGFVTTKASTRGKVKVYVDGVLKTTLKLTSSTTKYRNIAYVISYATSGTHTIKLVVYSGRVDVDAFVVLR